VSRNESDEWRRYGHDIDGANGGDLSTTSLSPSPDIIASFSSYIRL